MSALRLLLLLAVLLLAGLFFLLKSRDPECYHAEKAGLKDPVRVTNPPPTRYHSSPLTVASEL